MKIETEKAFIKHIPVMKWGPAGTKQLLAVHGLMSHKADTVIRLLAERAVTKSYQIISIDLPEHGDRKDGVKLNPWTCVDELRAIYDVLSVQAKAISLFGCSIGAYMSMLALADKHIDHSLFLSPVVSMRLLIEGMMNAFAITPEQLSTQKFINLPNAQSLDWNYYAYVCDHPIRWKKTTDILWGNKDDLIPEAAIDQFGAQSGAHVTKVASEHYFHTPEQLVFYTDWLSKKL